MHCSRKLAYCLRSDFTECPLKFIGSVLKFITTAKVNKALFIWFSRLPYTNPSFRGSLLTVDYCFGRSNKRKEK